MNVYQLTKILSVLDNPVKLKIIDVIYREGPMSLTDVKDRLKLSFSTTFKYLNQLERAGILNCKRTSVKGRPKNIYSVKFFDIRISPDTIADAMKGSESEEKKRSVVVLDWEGRLQNFDLSLLKEIFYNIGASKEMVDAFIKKINQNIYDGISFEEIRNIALSLIDEKASQVAEMRKAIQSTDIFSRKTNFLSILEQKGYHDVIRAHINRDFYIRNIGETYPLTMQHNFSLVLKHGLKIIGIDTKPASTIVSAISHFDTVIDATNKNLADYQQSFDSLNVFLAPFISGLPKTQIEDVAERIIYTQDQLYTVSMIRTLRTTINLELGVPDFLKKQPAYIGGKEVGVLGDFEAEAEQLLNAFLSVLKEKGKTFNPKIIIKVRDRKNIPENLADVLNLVYIANLIPKWQTENANYMYDWVRFDSSWKGWKRSFGVPHLQMVTLNLPRIGYLAKNEDEAIELIESQMRIVNKCFLATIESMLSKTFSELNFISKRIGEDKFCHLDDGLCTVGVTGMKELVELLAGDYAENKSLAIKIIKAINKELEKNELVRSGVVEMDFTPVTQSFLKSDSAKFKNAMKKYTGGVDLPLSDEEKIDFMGDLHEILKGGHMCQLKSLNMEKLEKVLKSNVGMVAGKGLDVF